MSVTFPNQVRKAPCCHSRSNSICQPSFLPVMLPWNPGDPPQRRLLWAEPCSVWPPVPLFFLYLETARTLFLTCFSLVSVTPCHSNQQTLQGRAPILPTHPQKTLTTHMCFKQLNSSEAYEKNTSLKHLRPKHILWRCSKWMLIQFLHKCREGFKTLGLTQEGAFAAAPCAAGLSVCS